MLAISVWAAIKNAISYETQTNPNLGVPASQEMILMSLQK
jgi:xanthine dehydrogenase molybdopterin-binding subunit B